ncbi:fibronectin type III domain-containing protein [Elusimicrobiota bacterium]
MGKFSPDLTLISSVTYDAGSTHQDFLYDIAVTSGGTVWTIGIAEYYSDIDGEGVHHASGSIWIMRHDLLMQLQQDIRISVSPDNGGYGLDLAMEPGGRVWMSGAQYRYPWFGVYDADGVPVASTGVWQVDGWVSRLGVAQDGSVWMAGNANSLGDPYEDIWLARLSIEPEAIVAASTAGVAIDCIDWSWQAPIAFPADSYRLYRASSGVVISTTSTVSFAETELATNTAYGLRVSGVNPSGEGDLSPAATVYTLAAAPVASALSNVSETSLQADWTANGNPPVTSYTATVSTGANPGTNGYSGNLSSTTFNLAAVFVGLSPGATYFAEVRATNGDSVPTAYTALGSILTVGLESPGAFAGTALGVSSISWTWSDMSGETGFKVVSLDGGSVSGDRSADSTSWIETGLQPNTTYTRQIVAFAATDASTSAAVTVYTAAQPPTGSAAVVHQTSATLSWSLNGNPAGTVAELERSTDAAAFANVLTSAASSFLDADLLVCSTYYYRVRNVNWADVATVYDSVLQFRTSVSSPLAPSVLEAVSLVGNRVGLGWTPSPSESVTEYRLYYDSGTEVIDYATPLDVLTSTETSYTAGVLASSAAYRFALRAYNRCGIEEQNAGVVASAASLASLDGVRASIKVPQSGKRVRGNRVTVVAELTLGGVAQTRQVRFQRKPSTSSTWSDIVAADAIHPNPDTGSPYFIHWDLTSIPTTAYDLRAVATDIRGDDDATPPAISIFVTDSGTEWDVSESLDSGKVKKEEKLNSAVENSLQIADEGSAQVAKITISSGALSASTVTITVVINPVSIPPAPADTTATSVVTQVDLSNGQTDLSGGRTATIVLTYPDQNGDGIVDGTMVRVSELEMYSAASLAGPWVPDLSSSINAASKTVTGLATHFSFFGLFGGGPAPDLDTVRVYPNPFMPNSGEPSDGVPYSSGDPNSGIIFDNLPASVNIKVYTLRGRLVDSFGSDSLTGKVQWDVENRSGQHVASGGYFAVITSPGVSAVVKKVLIVR